MAHPVPCWLLATLTLLHRFSGVCDFGTQSWNGQSGTRTSGCSWPRRYNTSGEGRRSLPLAMPHARGIRLQQYIRFGPGQTFGPTLPNTRGEFELLQLWAVSVKPSDDCTQVRLSARFLGYDEKKLIAFSHSTIGGGHPSGIYVEVKLCCDVQACLQQQSVLHGQALLPL